MSPRDLTWTGSEKKLARRAFEAALERVLAGIVAEFKARAARVANVSEMWDIEDYLRRQRKQVDELFDYRYSQLCFVFARLLCMGHLDETELAGLSEDKLAIIRDMRDRMRAR